MYKILCTVLLLLMTTPVFGGGQRVFVKDRYDFNNIRIQNKIIELNNRIRVLGIPITQGNYAPLYYWEVDKSKLTEQDREQLAELIADKVVIRLTDALEGVIGKLPDNPNPEPAPKPEPTTPDHTELDKKVQVLFTKYHCLECHGAGKRSGGFSLENHPIDRLSKYMIHDRVSRGEMPPKGDLLTDEEVEVIHEWARNKQEVYEQ